MVSEINQYIYLNSIGITEFMRSSWENYLTGDNTHAYIFTIGMFFPHQVPSHNCYYLTIMLSMRSARSASLLYYTDACVTYNDELHNFKQNVTVRTREGDVEWQL